MNEILKMLNALTADELDSVLMRGSIMLEKKRKEEAEAAIREQERIRQEKIAEEKRRLEEIAELQRKLQELQNQKIIIPEEPGKVRGDNFVMHDAPKPAAPAQAAPQPTPVQPQPAPAKPQAPQFVACPHCRLMNVAGSMFCSNCGQRMPGSQSAQQSAPAQAKPAKIFCPHCRQLNDADSLFCSNCGQKITVNQQASQPAPQPQAAPRPAPQPAYQPQSAPQPAYQPQASVAQVRYADESLKKWEMLPGEQIMRGKHEIFMLQPDGGKFAYYMEVTNRRILLTREGSAAKNVGMVARMGGGLVGSLIAEGVKAASGAGPKPWLEIPLAAITNWGLQNKKEFFIVADRTYVFKNHGYEKFLPDLITNAKR